MPNLLVMAMTEPCLRPSTIFIATSMEITSNCVFLMSSLLLGYWGVPPHLRHPQILWFTETGMPNFDPVFSLLLLTVAFEQMTIKHSLYMQKVH